MAGGLALTARHEMSHSGFFWVLPEHLRQPVMDLYSAGMGQSAVGKGAPIYLLEAMAEFYAQESLGAGMRFPYEYGYVTP